MTAENPKKNRLLPEDAADKRGNPCHWKSACLCRWAIRVGSFHQYLAI